MMSVSSSWADPQIWGFSNILQHLWIWVFALFGPCGSSRAHSALSTSPWLHLKPVFGTFGTQLDSRSSVFPVLLAVWKGNLYPCTTAGLAWLARCICGRGNCIPLTHRGWVVTARSRMLGLSGQRSDSGQQSLCSPAQLMGEIFCLISALLLATGSREKGRMASCRAVPYKAACVGWKVPCSLAWKGMWGCVCVCSGGRALLASNELVQINKRLKTARPQPLEKPCSRCCQWL